MSEPALRAIIADAMRPQRAMTVAATASGMAAAIAAVLLLGLSGWFIAGAAVAGAGGVAAAQAFNYLLPSAAIRLFATIRTLARYGERLYGHRAALSALATLRVQLFTRLMTWPSEATMALSAGDATARLVQDIDALEDMLVRKPALPSAIAAGTVGLILTAMAGPLPAVALFGILAVQSPLAGFLSVRLLSAPARQVQEGIGLLKRDMVEYATASAEIVAYGLAAPIAAQLESRSKSIDVARRAFARGDVILGVILTLSAGVAVAAVIALSSASMPVTALAALAAAAAVEAQTALIRSGSRGAIVGAGFARLASLADPAPPSSARQRLTGATLAVAGIILRKGERLVIAGPSGSGKTTLIETLAGLRPGRSGDIQIDGVPAADCNVDDLRPLFALSPQNAQMISGTIGDNLRLARPGLSDAQLWEALTVACLDTDVRAMPAGISAWIGDGGARLSGGQRKRLSIARALLARRPWLLLDEPSEGLDPATERELICRIEAWIGSERCGLIVVSHRPAWWALAERRLELEAG